MKSEGRALSYDYMLGKGDAATGLEGFMESSMNETIGVVDTVKSSITTLFPSVRWEQSTANSADSSGQLSWFGRLGPPEFHFLPEPNGTVRLLFMSHCERAEVERVARSLGLVAVDEQTMEIFGG
jgi:hypothetical protein